MPARSRRSRGRSARDCWTSTPIPTTTARRSRSPTRRAGLPRACLTAPVSRSTGSRSTARRRAPDGRSRRCRADRPPPSRRSRRRGRRGARARRSAGAGALRARVPVRDARRRAHAGAAAPGRPGRACAADHGKRADAGLRSAAAAPDRRRRTRRRPSAAGRVQRRARRRPHARPGARCWPPRSARAGPTDCRVSARSGCGWTAPATRRSRPTSRTTSEPRRRTSLPRSSRSPAATRSATPSSSGWRRRPHSRASRPTSRLSAVRRSRTRWPNAPSTRKLKNADGPDQAQAPDQAPWYRGRTGHQTWPHEQAAERRCGQEAEA